MVSLVNSHTIATSKRWHLFEIDLRFALNSTPGLIKCVTLNRRASQELTQDQGSTPENREFISASRNSHPNTDSNWNNLDWKTGFVALIKFSTGLINLTVGPMLIHFREN